MPLLYGLSRQYLVEYGLTALVAATVCHLVESPWLRDERNAFWLGLLCGLGLMMKVTFPLYVFLPFVFSCIQSAKAKPNPASYFKARPMQSRPSLLISVLAFVSPLALIALPWYARNLSKTFNHAFKSSFSPMADLYGLGNPFSISVIWRYLTEFVNNGISGAYLLLLMVLGAIGVWYQAQLKRTALPSQGRIYALLWFLPFVVFLFGRNKDIRFTAPLLPAVAIVFAWLTDSFLSSVKRWP